MRARSYGTLKIFLERHRLKMARVHAPTVAAKVIKGEASRNFPDKDFVNEPMCRGLLLERLKKSSVSVLVQVP
jgi:hypothetical protein